MMKRLSFFVFALWVPAASAGFAQYRFGFWQEHAAFGATNHGVARAFGIAIADLRVALFFDLARFAFRFVDGHHAQAKQGQKENDNPKNYFSHSGNLFKSLHENIAARRKSRDNFRV
jgi:hypothetical protein